MKNVKIPFLRKRFYKKKIYYYFECVESGKRCLKKLGDDYCSALEQYTKLIKIHSTKPESTKTLSHVWHFYQRDVLVNKAPRTQKDNKKEFEKLVDYFKNAFLDEIKPYHIKNYLNERAAKIRANREIALLSSVINYARQMGFITSANPCAGIKKNKEIGRKQIYVTQGTFELVYNNSSERLKNAMDLAFITGQRPADLLKMSWTDIWQDDEGSYFLTVTQNKTQKTLSFLVADRLLDLINKIKEYGESKTILNMTVSALRSDFDKARELAGIDKNTFQFKDIRAMAADFYAQKYGIKKAQSVLHHSNENMTRHYLRDQKGDKISLY